MVKYTTPQEAVKLIKSGDSVYIHGSTGSPTTLIDAMIARHNELRGVNIYGALVIGKTDYAKEEYKDSFTVHSLFVSDNLRCAVTKGYGYAIPAQLSEMPSLFREGIIPIDVILLNVSLPDAHGYCSMGVSVDATAGAYDAAKIVIAQINPNVPRIFGDGVIHMSDFNAIIEANDELVEVPSLITSAEDQKIGQYIANYIPDGATLQIGVGNIPNAVLSALKGHKHMGIHTEALTEGMIPLIECGAVDNSLKTLYKGKSVGSLAIGTRKLYDFMDNNPSLIMKDCAYTNNPYIIAQNPCMRSVNSAIEVDITGQVCADSIGTRIYSGVGGQNDFMYGSSLSPGGMTFIALTSMTPKGKSKITSVLSPGAGVTTNRYIIQNVVTEYGVAELRGKSFAQRSKALINIAHPSVREELKKEAYERYGASFLNLK